MSEIKKKKQVIRYTDSELSLIKATFSENDELLRAIRKVFLQMPLSVLDTTMIASVFGGNKATLALISKTFKPELDPEAPLHQLIDLWMSLDVKDKSIDEMYALFQGRNKLIELLEQQLKELKAIADKEPFERKIKLVDLVAYKPNVEGRDILEFYSNLIARNTLINHVEMQLMQLSNLAGLKDESPEETLKRLHQNSSK